MSEKVLTTKYGNKTDLDCLYSVIIKPTYETNENTKKGISQFEDSINHFKNLSQSNILSKTQSLQPRLKHGLASHMTKLKTLSPFILKPSSKTLDPAPIVDRDFLSESQFGEMETRQ